MSFDFTKVLPDFVSDETAFHLADFAMDLATAVHDHYLVQARRYRKKQREQQKQKEEWLSEQDPF